MNADHSPAGEAAVSTVDQEAAALLDALARAGHRGPALVIADNAAIARSAPAWARAFAAHGWRHRVRLCEETSSALADVAAEARSLAREAESQGSGVIVAVGGVATRAAARRAAAEAGLPVLEGTAAG